MNHLNSDQFYLNLDEILFSLMMNRLVFLLILLSLISVNIEGVKQKGRNKIDTDEESTFSDDQDEDASRQDSDQEQSVRSFIKVLGEDEEIDKEVNQLIGIHQQEIDSTGHAKNPADLSNIKKVVQNNKLWSKNMIKNDPEFFGRHLESQKPKYLYIGCSDSRLPANEILGLDYGEVFVLRNVANMVSPSDISSLAVLQYAIEVLQVSDIIIAGHYNCGGVKAALTKYNHGPLEAWLSKLRRIRHKHSHAFQNLTTMEEKARLLVEINVKQQVFNVASTPFVQQAWKDKRQLRIHGLVFSLQNGRLIDLNITMHTLDQLPEQLAVIE